MESFKITFRGHSNVRSQHSRTVEITKDDSLTVQGDCIVGVQASHSCADIPDHIRTKLRSRSTKVQIMLDVNGHKFEINGRGDPGLEITHKSDIVIRTSDYTCPRTLAVGCDAASSDIPKNMVHDLQNKGTIGVMSIFVS